MFSFEDFISTVQKAATIFDRHGVRFHLTGGAAGIAYGEPRMTQDVDLVVDNAVLASTLDLFIETLDASDFDYDGASVRQAVVDHDMFQLLDRVEILKLDVYPREMIPGELDRTVWTPIHNSPAFPMASREDTILSKLVWISKGSHKSRRDLRVLYRNTDDEQKRFIAEIAEQFQLTQLLAEVLTEPDEIR